MEVHIRNEGPEDYDSIDRVNRLAFGGEDEVEIVRRLRTSALTIASLVAVKGSDVVGHILFSRLPIETHQGRVHAVALGPLAVLPEYQRQGVGAALVREGLDVCRRRGESIVIVVGHPNYYSRFGFSAELARPLRSFINGDAWMALELIPAAMEGIKGTVQYPPEWGL